MPLFLGIPGWDFRPPVYEGSADTYHDHLHRGQDKSENASTRPLNAPPEGEEYMIWMQHYILDPNHVLFALGRCILKPFPIFRFILALGGYSHGMCLHSFQDLLKYF